MPEPLAEGRVVSKPAAPVVYPPERSKKVPCGNCNSRGTRSAIAGHCFDIDGGLWHEPGQCSAPECSYKPGGTCCPPCPSCSGSGEVDRRHYAYCKRVECIGCLPTLAELKRMPILDVFAEMLARCIPQSPERKTHDGAWRAIAENNSEYESIAYFARRHNRSGASGLFQLLGHGDMFEAHGWSSQDWPDPFKNSVVAFDLNWSAWVCR